MARKAEPKKESKTIKKQSHKRATFKFMAPEAESVLLAGDFNAWDPNAHPLKKVSNGMWRINVSLSPGRYEYRFLVDGQWLNDPECETFVPNPFGSDNSVKNLK